MNGFLFLSLVTLVACILCMLIEKRSILNGFFLTASLLFLLLAIVETATTAPVNRFDHALVLFSILFAWMFFIFLLFLVGYLVQNALKLIKKEGKKLSNLLSFFVSIAVLLFLVSGVSTIYTVEPIWVVLTLYVGFYGFLFLSFLVSSFLYRFNRPRYNQKYIIVLGAGLLNGKDVSPLLASRLNRAIYFYQMQKKVAPPPYIIVTGGRGADEILSEATAMRTYLLKQAIPPQQIIVEDQAKNTYENFVYSKALFQHKHDQAVFVSNHYHLLRSGIIARKLGVNAEGVGSPTAWYYVPNAYTREFMAILMMHLPIHMFLLLITIIGFLLMM